MRLHFELYNPRVGARVIVYQLFFSQYIYFVVSQPKAYISEIYYKFILEYMPFTTFIAISFYCDTPNRALIMKVNFFQ